MKGDIKLWLFVQEYTKLRELVGGEELLDQALYLTIFSLESLSSFSKQYFSAVSFGLLFL